MSRLAGTAVQVRTYGTFYVTAQALLFTPAFGLDQGIKNDAIVCPFLVPEGSRPPKVDSGKYNVEGYENIYYNTAFCPENADVISALSVRPDGKIYMQDFGGKISRDWRYGTLTYTVAPK